MTNSILSGIVILLLIVAVGVRSDKRNQWLVSYYYSCDQGQGWGSMGVSISCGNFELEETKRLIIDTTDIFDEETHLVVIAYSKLYSERKWTFFGKKLT